MKVGPIVTASDRPRATVPVGARVAAEAPASTPQPSTSDVVIHPGCRWGAAVETGAAS